MTVEQFKQYICIGLDNIVQDQWSGRYREADDHIEEVGGALWREMEDNDEFAQIGVRAYMLHQSRTLVFVCEDGIVSSEFSYGPEGETLWVPGGLQPISRKALCDLVLDLCREMTSVSELIEEANRLEDRR